MLLEERVQERPALTVEVLRQRKPRALPDHDAAEPRIEAATVSEGLTNAPLRSAPPLSSAAAPRPAGAPDRRRSGCAP